MTSPSKLGNILKYIDKATGGIQPKAWIFKFFPLVGIQAAAVFAYTMLKNTKNSVVTRVSPTTTFNWLKILVITPLALLFPILLKKIIDLLKDRREKVPYVLMGLFISIYLLFALVIFPLGDLLQLPWLINWLPNFQLGGIRVFGFVPPTLLNGIAHTFGYWGNSLFYGLAEVWAVVGINFLAWGIANDICSENETKIFYPSFGILSNLGAYLAARIMSGSNLSGLTGNTFINSLRKIILITVSAIACMALIYFFIERFVLRNPDLMVKRKEAKKKAKPENGLQMVLRNAYLQKIAIMVVAYALIIFLVEQCWYDSIIRTYGRGSYTAVTAKVAEINAVMTIVLSVISTFLLHSLPWVVQALVPVIMIGFSAVAFFIFYLLGRTPDAVSFLASSGLIGVTPLALAVIIGSFQNISARSSKYSYFDTSKEKAFRASPDIEVRTQGKAAVDVSFGRTAKGSGAFIIIILLSLHSVYVSFTQNFFQNKHNTENISSKHPEDSQEIGKQFSKEIAKQILTVKLEDGKYKVVVKDPNSIEHEGFEKTIQDGSVVFIQKAPVVQEKNIVKEKVQAPIKQESTIPDIAPIIFGIVLIVVCLWTYAVITLAPLYQMNLILSQEAENETSEELENKDSQEKMLKSIPNPFTPKVIIQLTAFSIIICGSLYFWVSREITAVVSKIDKNAPVDPKTLAKLNSMMD